MCRSTATRACATKYTARMRVFAWRTNNGKMAESDEEHERSRNRDKFRRERSDYGEKPRSRTDYRDRRTWRDDHEAVSFGAIR